MQANLQTLADNNRIILSKALDALNQYYIGQGIDPDGVDVVDKMNALCALIGAYITLEASEHPANSVEFIASADNQITMLKNTFRSIMVAGSKKDIANETV